MTYVTTLPLVTYVTTFWDPFFANQNSTEIGVFGRYTEKALFLTTLSSFARNRVSTIVLYAFFYLSLNNP